MGSMVPFESKLETKESFRRREFRGRSYRQLSLPRLLAKDFAPSLVPSC